MGKTNIFLVLGLILVMLVGACTSTSVKSDYSSSNAQSSGNTQQSSQGRAVFAVKDASADMESVTSVKTTIDSVKVHSQAEGWTTVSSSSQTYDWIQLKNNDKAALLADAQLKERTYDQVQIHISNVVVTDSKGTHEAKMPNKDYNIKGNLLVKADSTSSATFDFIADESVHATSQGDYVVAPVVEYQTKSDATVNAQSSSDVKISGGQTTTDVKVGMDINGNVGVGLGILSNTNLSIDSLGKISVVGQSSNMLGVGAGSP